MEIWREIEGYNQEYLISNQGRVKSLIRNKILKPQLNKKGYYKIELKRKAFFVHVLVANAFIEKDKPQVNHKNGIKTDNRVENLEWVTQSENSKHSYGLQKKKFGKDNHYSKIVEQYTIEGVYIRTWDSVADAARSFGLKNPHKSKIYEVCNGKLYSYRGYKWIYPNKGGDANAYHKPTDARGSTQ